MFSFFISLELGLYFQLSVIEADPAMFLSRSLVFAIGVRRSSTSTVNSLGVIYRFQYSTTLVHQTFKYIVLYTIYAGMQLYICLRFQLKILTTTTTTRSSNVSDAFEFDFAALLA